MKVGLITREYPPDVYGGAGVHVEYLSRELAQADRGRGALLGDAARGRRQSARERATNPGGDYRRGRRRKFKGAWMRWR